GDQGDANLSSQTDLHDLLEAAGLPKADLIWECHTGDEAISVIEALDSKRHDLPYETDGAVIKVNSVREQNLLGVTSKSPLWARAYKYPPLQAETQILDVDIQVGRTGALTPVARLAPTRLSGSTVSNATLHNFDEITRKDVRIFDFVVIEKRGEIIPAVVEVKTAKRTGNEKVIHPPKRCPACGAPVLKEEGLVVLRCSSLTCSAQLKRRLEFFAARRALDLDGIGGIVAKSLVESGLVKDPLDVFTLNPAQLAELNLGTEEDRRVFGKKNAARVISAIETSRKLPLHRWIFALGIHEVGTSTALELAKHHSTFRELANSELLADVVLESKLEADRLINSPQTFANKTKNAHEKQILKIRESEIREKLVPVRKRLANVKLNQIGPVAAESVLAYFSSEIGRATLNRLDELGINPTSSGSISASNGILEGKIFVLTGTLSSMTRDEAADKIRAQGGSVTGSVSKKTSFVVAGSDPGENKIEGANKHSVPVLNEAEFLKLIGHEVVTHPPKIKKDLFE
ncbi:MAG: NAD-dependent DNA ligase LigA, partial [Verrucomicrobia bacterium]|nr:NAD-dependent DNA ligase LigA [Verrucomicrobiota bacterium]